MNYMPSSPDRAHTFGKTFACSVPLKHTKSYKDYLPLDAEFLLAYLNTIYFFFI